MVCLWPVILWGSAVAYAVARWVLVSANVQGATGSPRTLCMLQEAQIPEPFYDRRCMRATLLWA